MSVKAALQLINAELDEYLGGIQGEFDPDTRFAISWYEQNGIGNGDYGMADNLARARGIAVESVKTPESSKVRAGKVRILKRSELDPEWEPQADTHLTVWECLQYLVRSHEKDGISQRYLRCCSGKIDDKAEAKDRLLPLRHLRQQAADGEGGHRLQRADCRLVGPNPRGRRDFCRYPRNGQDTHDFEGAIMARAHASTYSTHGVAAGRIDPLVEKRLESQVKGHWQVEAVQRVRGLRPTAKVR